MPFPRIAQRICRPRGCTLTSDFVAKTPASSAAQISTGQSIGSA